MWVKSPVPAMAGAKLVVSLKGDILSPKYAPEIIAPAMIPSENPMAFPMPSNARPTVATVLHELPVDKETMQQTMQAAGKK